MLRSVRLIALLGALVVSLVAPAAVSASTDCGIAALGTTTASLSVDPATGDFNGKSAEKDRSGLVQKVDNAFAAFSAGKYVGAIQKLDDFSSKVTSLRDTGKLDAEPANALLADAAAARSCVEALTV